MGVSAVGDWHHHGGLGEEESFILGHVAGGVTDFLCSLMAVPNLQTLLLFFK